MTALAIMPQIENAWIGNGVIQRWTGPNRGCMLFGMNPASNEKWKVLLFILLVTVGLGSRFFPEVRKVRMTDETLARGASSNGIVDNITRNRRGFDLYYHYSVAGAPYQGHDWCHYYRQWWLSMPKPGNAIPIRIHPDAPQFSLSTYSVYYGAGRYGLLVVCVLLFLVAMTIAMVCLYPSWWSEKLRSWGHKMDKRSQRKIKDVALKKVLEKTEELGGEVLGWDPGIVVQYKDAGIKKRIVNELTKQGWFLHENEEDLKANILTFTRTL